MKNKSIKFAKSLLDMFLALILIVALGAFCLTMYCYLKYDVQYAKYLYVLVGVFLFPIEFISVKNITGIIIREANMGLCLGLTGAIVVFAIVAFVLSSKMYNKSISAKKRKVYGIIECMLVFVLLSYFAVSAVLMLANFSTFENGMNGQSPEIIKELTLLIGANAVVLKEVIVACAGIFILLFALIVFIVGMSHKSTKTKIYSSINFYSAEYEPTEEEKTVVQEEKVKVSADIPEKNQKAKDLIKKIMQLEELKKAGKISAVDYTRLRQKAIRRYKDQWKSFFKILKSLLARAML